MYLFYIDESGNTGSNLESVDQPVHLLVALGVTPSALREIEAEMLALAARAFPAAARKPEFEFHGSDIFSGRRDCQQLGVGERVALFDRLVSLVRKHECVLFIRGINKARHRDRARDRGYSPWHPYRVGFMYLIERIDEWLEQQQPEPDLLAGSLTPVYGLLVADEQKEMDREIVSHFAFWRDSGTDGYRSREIRYLIDTVHYVPSHDSWLIQLADCVAFIRNRHGKIVREKGWETLAYTQSEKAVARLWRDHCLRQVVDDRIWP